MNQDLCSKVEEFAKTCAKRRITWFQIVSRQQAQTNPHLKNLEKKVFKTKTKGSLEEERRMKQH